jgi:hypothetical protein
MSLEECHECGHEISDSATECPKCGAGQKAFWYALKLVAIAVIEISPFVLLVGYILYLLINGTS